MNFYGVLAIYRFEMSRTRRTLIQSIVAPVITTSLYFIVFGAAIGSRIQEVGGVSYGAFIVPGLIMLNLLTNSISNGSFGIYFPKFVGTVYEILSARCRLSRSSSVMWVLQPAKPCCSDSLSCLLHRCLSSCKLPIRSSCWHF